MAGFENAGARIIEGVAAGLYKGATVIMARSQPIVPVETGTLKSSGVVGTPEREGDSLVCEVGYGYGDEINPISGDPAVGYAVYVHERLDVHHAAPTQAKFLEMPARELEPELGGIIREEVQARTGI